MAFQRPLVRDSWIDRTRDRVASWILRFRIRVRARLRESSASAEPHPGRGPDRSTFSRFHRDPPDAQVSLSRVRLSSTLVAAVVAAGLGLVLGLVLGFGAARSVGPDRGLSANPTRSPAAGSSATRTTAAGPLPAVAELPIITSVPGPTTSTTVVLIAVHAAGAFRRPGVYVFALGARVDDLLAAAGGVNPDAQTDILNLAAPLADGQRVWVPIRGQPIPSVAPADIAPAVTGAASGAVSGGGGSSSGAKAGDAATVVSLNTATVEQLDALPGVGPATAAAIVEYRVAHQRFRSIGELLNVRGIGEAKLAAIRSKVRL